MATLTPLVYSASGPGADPVGDLYEWDRGASVWTQGSTIATWEAAGERINESLTSSEASGDTGIGLAPGAKGSASVKIGLSQVDADFASMDTLRFHMSTVDYNGNYSDDHAFFGVSVFDSADNQLAHLYAPETGAEGLGIHWRDSNNTNWEHGASTAPGYNIYSKNDFAFLTGTKAQWDDAYLLIEFTDGATKGSDNGAIILVDFELTGTYTAASTTHQGIATPETTVTVTADGSATKGATGDVSAAVTATADGGVIKAATAGVTAGVTATADESLTKGAVADASVTASVTADVSVTKGAVADVSAAVDVYGDGTVATAGTKVYGAVPSGVAPDPIFDSGTNWEDYSTNDNIGTHADWTYGEDNSPADFYKQADGTMRLTFGDPAAQFSGGWAILDGQSFTDHGELLIEVADDNQNINDYGGFNLGMYVSDVRTAVNSDNGWKLTGFPGLASGDFDLLRQTTSGSGTLLVANFGNWSSDAQWWVRWRVEKDTPSAGQWTHSIKRWTGTLGSEPGTWDETYTDTTPGTSDDHSPGYLWIGYDRRQSGAVHVDLQNLTLWDADPAGAPPIAVNLAATGTVTKNAIGDLTVDVDATASGTKKVYGAVPTGAAPDPIFDSGTDWEYYSTGDDIDVHPDWSYGETNASALMEKRSGGTMRFYAPSSGGTWTGGYATLDIGVDEFLDFTVHVAGGLNVWSTPYGVLHYGLRMDNWQNALNIHDGFKVDTVPNISGGVHDLLTGNAGGNGTLVWNDFVSTNAGHHLAYYFRLRMEKNGDDWDFSAKLWDDDLSEPGSWDATHTVTDAETGVNDAHTPGYFGIAFDLRASVGGPAYIDFGSLKVYDADPAGAKPISVTLDATPTVTKNAIADVSVDVTGTVTGTVTGDIKGEGDIAVAAAVTAAGGVTYPAIGGLSSTATLAAAGTVFPPTLSVDLTATGRTFIEGVADISTAVDITADGTVATGGTTHQGIGHIAVDATLTADATNTVNAVADVSAAVDAAGNASVNRPGSASPAIATTLSATGSVAQGAVADVSTTVDATGIGSTTYGAVGDVTAAVTIDRAVGTTGGDIQGVAHATVDVAGAAAATMSYSVAGDVSAAVDATGTGSVVRAATAAFTADVSLNAEGSPTKNATADISTTVSITSSATMSYSAIGQITSDVTIDRAVGSTGGDINGIAHATVDVAGTASGAMSYGASATVTSSVDVYGESRRIVSGQVPSLWSPSKIEDLDLWLDADDADSLTLDTSDVITWADKSDAGQDFTQTTPSQRPVVSSNYQNGLDAIQFTRANEEHLNGGDAIDTLTGTRMVAVIGEVGSLTGDHAFIAKYRNTLSDFRWRIYFDGDTDDIAVEAAKGAGGDVLARSEGAEGLGWMLLVGEVTTETSAQLWLNGLDQGKDTVGASVSGDQTWTAFIGTSNATTATVHDPSYCLDGYIGEIVSIDAVVVERQEIEGYLAHRWGLSSLLPGGHIYKAEPPPGTTTNVTLTLSPGVFKNSTADVAVSADLTATGTVKKGAVADATLTVDLTGTVGITHAGQASLTAAVDLTADSTNKVFADADVSITVDVAAAGRVVYGATAGATATVDLTGTGSRTRNGVAELSTTVDVAASGSTTYGAVADATVDVTIDRAFATTGGEIGGVGFVDVAVTLNGSATATYVAAADATADVDITATGSKTLAGLADVSTDVTVAATGGKILSGVADLTVAVDVEATGIAARPASADVSVDVEIDRAVGSTGGQVLAVAGLVVAVDVEGLAAPITRSGVAQTWVNATRSYAYYEHFTNNAASDGSVIEVGPVTSDRGSVPTRFELQEWGEYRYHWIAVSPDRSKVLYGRDPKGASGNTPNEIWVSGPTGQSPTRIMSITSGDEQNNENNYSEWGHHEWLDNNTIVFSGNAAADTTYSIWKCAADGTGHVQLTDGTTLSIDPSVTPDGRILYINGAILTTSQEIWIMDDDGLNKTRLSTDSYADWDPYASPDNTRIINLHIPTGVVFDNALRDIDGSNYEVVLDGSNDGTSYGFPRWLDNQWVIASRLGASGEELIAYRPDDASGTLTALVSSDATNKYREPQPVLVAPLPSGSLVRGAAAVVTLDVDAYGDGTVTLGGTLHQGIGQFTVGVDVTGAGSATYSAAANTTLDVTIDRAVGTTGGEILGQATFVVDVDGTATATVTYAAAAIATLDVDLTATGSTGGIVAGQATLTSAVDVTADASRTRGAIADSTTAVDLTADANRTLAGVADVSTEIDLYAQARLESAATGDISLAVSVQASAGVRRAGAGDVSVGVDLDGSLDAIMAAAFTLAVTMVAAASVIKRAQAATTLDVDLEGLGTGGTAPPIITPIAVELRTLWATDLDDPPWHTELK